MPPPPQRSDALAGLLNEVESSPPRTAGLGPKPRTQVYGESAAKMLEPYALTTDELLRSISSGREVNDASEIIDRAGRPAVAELLRTFIWSPLSTPRNFGIVVPLANSAIR